jgi:hypothetical protein
MIEVAQVELVERDGRVWTLRRRVTESATDATRWSDGSGSAKPCFPATVANARSAPCCRG